MPSQSSYNAVPTFSNEAVAPNSRIVDSGESDLVSRRLGEVSGCGKAKVVTWIHRRHSYNSICMTRRKKHTVNMSYVTRWLGKRQMAGNSLLN